MAYNKNTDNYNKGGNYDQGKQSSTGVFKYLLYFIILLLGIYLIYSNKEDIEYRISTWQEAIEERINREYSYEDDEDNDEAEDAIYPSDGEESDDDLFESDFIRDDDDDDDDDDIRAEIGFVEQTPPEESPTATSSDSDTPNTRMLLTSFVGSDGKSGLKDEQTKKVVLEAKYDGIASLLSGSQKMWKPSYKGKYGLYNERGEEVLGTVYDEVTFLTEFTRTNYCPYFVFKKEGKWGVVDASTKKIIVAPQYMRIDGTGFEQRGGKNMSAYFVLHSSDGVGIMRISDHKVIIPLQYQSVSISGKNFLVEKNNKHGIVDVNNNIIVPIKYNSIPVWTLDEHYGHVFRVGNDSYEAYDDTGYRQLIASEQTLAIDDIGVFVYKKDKKQGVYSTSQNILLIDAKYDYVCPVKIDRSIIYIVSKDGKYGVIDEFEKTLVPFTYSYISPLNSAYDRAKKAKSFAYLRVHKGSLSGLIQISNRKLIVPVAYEQFELATSEFLWVMRNKKYGIVSTTNKVLIDVDNQWIPKVEVADSEAACSIRMLEGQSKNRVFYNYKGQKVAGPY